MAPESSLYIMIALAHQKYTYLTGHSEKSSIILFHETGFLTSVALGAVVMSPDSEGLGAAVEAGVGSNLIQPGVFLISTYTLFSEVHESVLILDRNSLLKFV